MRVPTARTPVVHAAVRLLPEPVRVTVPQPLMVAPSEVKATVPAGVAPTTVAVKVTGVPTAAGLALLTRVVVVDTGPLVMTCESGALVDAPLAELPPKSATMGCVPTLSVVVAHAAVRLLPLPTRLTALQPVIVEPSLLNETEPVGALPLTVAVNMTLAPATAGLDEVASVVVVAVLTVCDNALLADAPLPASPL